jgi:uncharacterized iron-regulated membrane protein
VWRWHFYAGLFCVPFILWLSITGAVYLFKPQIEGWLYAPYHDVATPGRAMLPPSSIVIDGTAAVPGSVLHKYILPDAAGDSVQLLVGKGSEQLRLWVHPQSGAVLKSAVEEDRFMRIVFRLHGELLAGQWGSALVEIAACWSIIMILSGLFLWWPRPGTTKGLGGLLWPRLRQGKQRFWRDIHAVTGIWVSLAAILLILSGLPWAKSWGDYLRQVRTVTGAVSGPQDWSAGSEADARARAALDRDARASLGRSTSPSDRGGAAAGATKSANGGGEHEGHEGHGGMIMAGPPPSLAALDTVIPTAQALGFAGPVEIRPPKVPGGLWTVQSQAENRTRRAAAEIAPNGRLVGVQPFESRHWIDRVVGYGVAIHEGAWFGLLNQLINLAVLLGLITLALTSIILWWRRRPKGLRGRTLGAPAPKGALRHSWVLVGLVMVLGVMMPLFGISLAVVAMVEWPLRRSRLPIARWLGLRVAA